MAQASSPNPAAVHYESLPFIQLLCQLLCEITAKGKERRRLATCSKRLPDPVQVYSNKVIILEFHLNQSPFQGTSQVRDLSSPLRPVGRKGRRTTGCTDQPNYIPNKETQVVLLLCHRSLRHEQLAYLVLILMTATLPHETLRIDNPLLNGPFLTATGGPESPRICGFSMAGASKTGSRVLKALWSTKSPTLGP